MLIPSASPCRYARVSISSSPSLLSPFSKLGSIPSSLPVRLSIPRRCPSAVLCCSSSGMAEMVEDKKSSSGYHRVSPSFLDVQTEEGCDIGRQSLNRWVSRCHLASGLMVF